MKKILIIYGPKNSEKSKFIETQLPAWIQIGGRQGWVTNASEDLLYKLYMEYCGTAFLANNAQFVCLDDVPFDKLPMVMDRLMEYHKLNLFLPLVITTRCDEFTLPAGASINERFELLNVADIPENGLPEWFNFAPAKIENLGIRYFDRAYIECALTEKVLEIDLDFARTLNWGDTIWIDESADTDSHPYFKHATKEILQKWSDGWYAVVHKCYFPNGMLELTVMEIHSRDENTLKEIFKPLNTYPYRP